MVSCQLEGIWGGEERTRGTDGDGSANFGASCTRGTRNGRGDSCSCSEPDAIVLPAVVIPPFPTASRESRREPHDKLVQFGRVVCQMDREREAIPRLPTWILLLMRPRCSLGCNDTPLGLWQ